MRSRQGGTSRAFTRDVTPDREERQKHPVELDEPGVGDVQERARSARQPRVFFGCLPHGNIDSFILRDSLLGVANVILIAAVLLTITVLRATTTRLAERFRRVLGSPEEVLLAHSVEVERAHGTVPAARP